MDLSVYVRRPVTPREQEAKRADAEAKKPTNLENSLTPAARTLLAALPLPMRPQRLLEYPQVINVLAEYWNRPEAARRYFEDLLLDDRVQRYNFTLSVIGELSALRSYYESRVHPVKADVWSSVHRRS